MVTPDVGKLFLNNEKAIRKRRVVHAGMKVFDNRNLGDQKVLRLCQEGVHLLLPYLMKRDKSMSKLHRIMHDARAESCDVDIAEPT